jgi:putative flippase GtrA
MNSLSASRPRLDQLAQRWLTRRTDNTLIQLFRYAFVGCGAYLVDFGSLFLLTEYAGLHYLISAALAFCGGLLTNYLLSVAWVFNRRGDLSRAAEFGTFALIGLVGLLLNEVIIGLGVELLDIHYLLAKIVATVFVFAWNFLLRKRLLFR